MVLAWGACSVSKGTYLVDRSLWQAALAAEQDHGPVAIPAMREPQDRTQPLEPAVIRVRDVQVRDYWASPGLCLRVEPPAERASYRTLGVVLTVLGAAAGLAGLGTLIALPQVAQDCLTDACRAGTAATLQPLGGGLLLGGVALSIPGVTLLGLGIKRKNPELRGSERIERLWSVAP